ncbi:hypothetical protein INP81_19145 [Comamonas thiooxydans]|uniref:hypothetical protein n=1 Tax=Comamonas thiooxydans TaxID=363952 RepID=UPI0018A5F5E0|nr:hypothetical protein [Comamonas thiooxydans]QOQ84764.1 hypothetical protein INP81_19145 [Comamonas thiooxydans]
MDLPKFRLSPNAYALDLFAAEAVWKRIFAESAIGTPRHSRSLNGLAYFLEHGGTQAIWVPIYAALQVKIKP